MNVMAEAGIRRFALIGTPNSGKTALFNALTGSRQKVANYPGVTVERKTGALRTPSGRSVEPRRPARHLFAAGAQPRRRSDPRRRARPFRQRDAARPAGLRRRRHQSAAGLAPGARTQARRPADAARAQHDRHRPPARRRRSISTGCRPSSACRSITSAAVRRGGTDDLLRRLDELAAAEPTATG